MVAFDIKWRVGVNMGEQQVFLCSVETSEASHSTLGLYLDYLHRTGEAQAWPPWQGVIMLGE